MQGVLAGINSIVLLILVIKYVQEVRYHRLSVEHQRLEIDRLHQELEAARVDTERARAGLVAATEKDVEQYIIRPLVERLDKAISQFSESAHSLRDLHESMTAIERRATTTVEDAEQAHTNMLRAIQGELQEIRGLLVEYVKQRAALGSQQSQPQPTVALTVPLRELTPDVLVRLGLPASNEGMHPPTQRQGGG